MACETALLHLLQSIKKRNVGIANLTKYFKMIKRGRILESGVYFVSLEGNLLAVLLQCLSLNNAKYDTTSNRKLAKSDNVLSPLRVPVVRIEL